MKFFLILSNLFKFILLYFRRGVHFIVARLLYKYINQITESKQKNLAIVYDFHTNNPTFGEYILFLIIAKYLQLKKKKIEIILITNSRKNHTFKMLSAKEILIYKNELKKLTFFFLKKHFIEYSNFKEFALNYHDKKQTTLFSFFVFNRLRIHIYIMKIMNLLLSKEKKLFINKMKFTNKNIKISKKLQSIKPYISWHIRKNDKWGTYNNTKDEILKIANYLKLQKKNYTILIVSDKKACIWARKILKKFNKISYSDKIANGFVNSAIAVVNSDYYFQFKAGGLTYIANMTNIPYKIIAFQSPLDMAYSKKKMLSWQQNNQKRVYNYKKIKLSEVLKEKL